MVINMALIELTVNQAVILAYTVPLVAFVSTILMDMYLKRTESGRLNSIFSFILHPFQFSKNESDTSDMRKHLLLFLGLMYTTIFIFLMVNIIAELYFVLGDAAFPVTQGSTGATAQISKIVIENPWWSGWYGDLPWYHGYPYPLPGTSTFHNTWEWILYTAFFVDNPVFLENFIFSINVLTLLAASVYWLPLLLRRIRDSFIPSFFFLSAGIFTYIRPSFGLFAQAYSFQFEGDVLQFGAIPRGGTEFVGNTAMSLMSSSILQIILIGVFFIVAGGFLWKRHYDKSMKQSLRFMFMLAIGYALSFLGAMAVY